MNETVRHRGIVVGAIDDHEVTLHGIKAIVASVPHLTLAVAERSMESALPMLRGVDVVLLDLFLPNDPDVAENVTRAKASGGEVLIHTRNPVDTRARAALRAGALGVVGKDRVDELLEAIEQASVHRPYLSRALAQLIHSDPDSEPSLSAREREAVKGLAEGLPVKSVARRMSISVATVNDYVGRAREKYERQGRPASTRVDLLRRAMEDGLVPPPHVESLDGWNR